MATVFIPPLLRELTGGVERVEAPGATVRQIVAALDTRYPGLGERLCAGGEAGAGGELRPGLAVAVNGAVSSVGLMQKVPDGSEVHFLPAIGGG
jgi:molybdopterin synthase sulfur carrier subunit